MKGYRVQVEDLRNGKIYHSMTEAAEALYVTPATVSQCWRKGGSEVCGIPVRFIPTAFRSRCRKCRCVETGEIFDSCTEAGKKYGIKSASSSISSAMRKGHKAGGYHWRSA